MDLNVFLNAECDKIKPNLSKSQNIIGTDLTGNVILLASALTEVKVCMICLGVEVYVKFTTRIPCRVLGIENHVTKLWGLN